MPAVRFGPGQIRGGAARLWHAHGVAVVSGVALVVFAACFAWHWRLPGLYMDAVNPEYLLPGVLEPPPPFDLAIPGNRLDGWPVFTGTVYHGSVQLYAALPFAAVLGSDLSTFRIVQMLVGAADPGHGRAAGGAALRRQAGAGGVRRGGDRRGARVRPVAAHAGVQLHVPAVAAARRACSCCSRARGRVAATAARRRARGVLFGLAAFSYFIYWFFLPALLWLVLAERGAGLPRLGA